MYYQKCQLFDFGTLWGPSQCTDSNQNCTQCVWDVDEQQTLITFSSQRYRKKVFSCLSEKFACFLMFWGSRSQNFEFLMKCNVVDLP